MSRKILDVEASSLTQREKGGFLVKKEKTVSFAQPESCAQSSTSLSLTWHETTRRGAVIIGACGKSSIFLVKKFEISELILAYRDVRNYHFRVASEVLRRRVGSINAEIRRLF